EAEADGEERIGKRAGTEPGDAGGAEREHAEAAGDGGSDGQKDKRKNCAMDSDGEVRALVRGEPEHVPQAPARGHERHGKDEPALDGDRKPQHEADDDERREDERQDERGDKDTAEVSAKVRMWS